MENHKKYHFEKLTPNENGDIRVYESAIDFVFEHDDIRNVAISGAYGAGKSSVLLSYQKNLKGEKTIDEIYNEYLQHADFYAKAKQLHTFEFIQKMKDAGLSRKTGISFHGTPDLLEYLLKNYPEIDLVQLNYADWDDAGVQSRRLYEICMEHGKSVLVMEPVKGGNLANLPEAAATLLKEAHADWSQARWAISFAASLPGVYRVLSGMSTLEQVEDNTAFMQDFAPLTVEETALCAKAAAIIKSNTAIACTGCRYCEGECPNNIAISNYFALYNEEKRASVNYVHASGFYYKAMTQTRGKASDCIECGLCEQNCPQNLPIRENLKLVKAMFEK